MSIENASELAALKLAGRVVREALGEMKRAARPGLSTAELDAIGGAVFARHGARSAPQLVYRFPGINCLSVNEEVVHGVPSGRKLRRGDLLTIDVTAELGGFMADAAATIEVGGSTPAPQRLIAAARAALARGIAVARAGVRLSEIGRAIELEVIRRGFHVLRPLTGHGIGRHIHEEPAVPNFYDPSDQTLLSEGLVITIEPIIATSPHLAAPGADGWTISTADGGLAAHAEHTIVVRGQRPLLLTA